MMRKFYKNYLCLFLIFYLVSGCTSSNTHSPNAAVYIKKTGDKYSIIRNGRTFRIKGAAGFSHLAELKELGGNTIRLYDTTNLAGILDTAFKYNLAVIAALPMPKSKVIEYYDNDELVNKMHQDFMKVVNRHKNHPALLMWTLGNELRFPNRFKYRNFYSTFNKLSSSIHQADPNHPITTSIENLDATDVFNIRLRTKYVDLICINTFSALPRLKSDLKKYSWLWDGPFIISEWGIPGTWEERRTSWGAPIEKTSTEKAAWLYKYSKYIPNDDGRCLGSLIFYWGAKQERTHTWYNLFSESGLKSEPLAAIADLWLGKKFANHAPKVASLAFDRMTGTDNLIFKPRTSVNAVVNMVDPDRDRVDYKWEILPEDWYFLIEQNAHKPKAIEGLGSTSNSNMLRFKTPAKEGPYRVFVTGYDHKGNFATANIPFYVMN